MGNHGTKGQVFTLGGERLANKDRQRGLSTKVIDGAVVLSKDGRSVRLQAGVATQTPWYDLPLIWCPVTKATDLSISEDSVEQMPVRTDSPSQARSCHQTRKSLRRRHTRR